MSEARSAATASAEESKPRKHMKSALPVELKGLKLSSDDPQEQALIDVLRALGVARARAVIDAIEQFEQLLAK